MTTCKADASRIVYRGSIEWIDVIVTADVVLDVQEVFLSFVPHPYEWLVGAWQGDPGQTRTASVLGSDANLPEDNTEVFVKVSDNPEVPIRSAGPLYRP